MRYLDFIAEIEHLAAVGDSLNVQGNSHETRGFRDWRHRVESLVDEVKAHGYRLPGEFRSASRVYRSPYAIDTHQVYSRDLADSVTELRHLIEHYRKYGEPKHVQLVAQPEPEAPLPPVVTFAWLWKNVSMSFWGKVAAIAIAIFLAGALVGQTREYDALETWVKNTFKQGATAPNNSLQRP